MSKYPICHNCGNESTVITPEDELVCSNCGRVLECMTSHAQNLPSSHDYQLILSGKDIREIREKILDVCDSFHVPTYLTENILLAHSKLKSTTSDRFTKMERLAYAMYITLNKEKIPRSPNEIGYFFNINPSRLHEIEKNHSEQYPVEAIDLLSRVMSELNIRHYLSSSISHEIQRIQSISLAKPETILACAIFRVCKSPYQDLTVQDISTACGVSTASLRSLNSRVVRGRRERHLKKVPPSLNISS